MKNICQSSAFRWLVGYFVGALITLHYSMLAFWNQHIFSNQPMRQPIEDPAPTASQVQPDDQIIILYWTSFFESKDFYVGTGSKPFSQCDGVIASSCLTTTDRGLLNDSDAVIFHGRDLHFEDLPPPGWRRPHQKFIFFLLESPVHTNLDMLSQPLFSNYFNTTMTYRRDSDIFNNAYGRIACSVGHSAPSLCIDFFPQVNNSRPTAVKHTSSFDSASLFRDSVHFDLAMKNRTVAWFVSNCQTNSRRESLVRNLSQFIAVDVFGGCGDGVHNCANRVECDRMLSRHYRFYLSFENSLCPDYVTEKLYRPLAHDTVPVVYGGANYSLYLPAKSYVNARDFAHPKALANHLKKLMVDDSLYASYFHWKEKYAVDLDPKDAWCSLCKFLRDSKKGNEKKTYEDIAAWWSGQTINQTCTAPPP